MRTACISIEAAKKSPGGATITLERLDDATGRFVAVPGARAALPADLSVRAATDDPEQPGIALTTQRAMQLSAQSPVPAAVGLFLHRLLFGGKLAAAWKELRGDHVRVLLRLGTDAKLHALPWERSHDENGDYLALRLGSPLARWSEPAAALSGLRADDWPIRMLIVHGAEPGAGAGAAARVAADDEMMSLERILGTPNLRQDVEYDVLEHPTRQQVVEACRTIRPHVLHVIAHAQDSAAGGDLLLWQPAAPGRLAFNDAWKAADIKLQLQTLAPRLVFLNACRSSAAAPGAGPMALASLTHAFMQAGSAATIGMQGEVAGDLAQAFAETFYRRLVETQGADIDAAVSEARIAMAGKRPGASVAEDADWAFPVLTRCVAHDQVLPRAPQRLAALSADRFVARLQERREAHAAIRCAAPPAPGFSEHVAVIVGGRGSGKAYLAEWTAQACQRAGMSVARVPFIPKDKVDWLDALRWLRDGQKRASGVTPMPLAPVPDWPLQPDAFRQFNWALNRRLDGLPTLDGLPAGGAPIADQGRELSRSDRPPPSLVEDTFGAFQDAVAASAPAGGLLFKLDRLDGIDHQSLVSQLTEYWLKPLAAGKLKNVRLLLVMEPEAWAELEPKLPVRPRVVNVPYFKRGDFNRVARQYCHQWSGELYAMQGLRESLSFAFRGKEEPVEWGTEVLKYLGGVLSLMAQQQGVAV